MLPMPDLKLKPEYKDTVIIQTLLTTSVEIRALSALVGLLLHYSGLSEKEIATIISETSNKIMNETLAEISKYCDITLPSVDFGNANPPTTPTT